MNIYLENLQKAETATDEALAKVRDAMNIGRNDAFDGVYCATLRDLELSLSTTARKLHYKIRALRGA